MHPEEIKAIATEAGRAAAGDAVHRTFQLLGIDAGDPIATQEDFAVLRGLARLARDVEYRKDFEFVRILRTREIDGAEEREATEHFIRDLKEREATRKAIRDRVVSTSVGAVVVAGLAALWLGVQTLMSGPRPH